MVSESGRPGLRPLGDGALFQVAKTAAEPVDLAEAGPAPIPGPFDSRGAPAWPRRPSRTGPPSPRTRSPSGEAGTATGATRVPGRDSTEPPI